MSAAIYKHGEKTCEMLEAEETVYSSLTSRLPFRRAAMSAVQSQQSTGRRHDQKSG